MNSCKIWLVAAVLAISTCALAQTATDVKILITEGADLNNQKNYAGAIEKYQEALKIDAGNVQANYQIAFSLNASGKSMDAIPYLRKVVSSTASATIISSAYELMGSIYDKGNQLPQAIEAYRAGIQANPAAQSLLYNLGLAYFRNKQYADAESSAIAAIKLDPKQASYLRLYALVTFHQDKRTPALLGFCSFLLLEPKTARSAEAYGNIQHILQGGVLKPAPGEKPIVTDADTKALNLAIMQAVAPFAKRKYASAADLLADQLKAIFTAVGTLAGKQSGNDFFRNYMAAYFYQLSQTPNMPAFARLVSLSNPESAKWAATNAQQMTDLDNWVKATERGF